MLYCLMKFVGKPSDFRLPNSSRRSGTVAALGVARRLGFGALRRCPLLVSPPALERLFIASPVG